MKTISATCFWLLWIAQESLCSTYIDLDFTTSAYPDQMVDSFLELVLNHENFVDKSLLIRDFLATNQTIVVTRPPKWGKSLNMDMLRLFLKMHVDKDGNLLPTNYLRVLFEGGLLHNSKGQTKCLKPLKIAQLYPQIVKQHQGRYPVIHINSALYFTDNHPSMKYAIRKIFLEDFKFLTKYFGESNFTLEGCDVNRLDRYINHNETLNGKDAFRLLIDVVSAHFNNSIVYVFVDEYDHFSNILDDWSPSDGELILDQYHWHVKILGDIFDGIFRDMKNVRGMFTGVSIIPKREASNAPHFNYIKEDTVWQPLFIYHYGFAEDEVDSLLSVGPRSPLYEKSYDVKRWYRGYVIGGETLYNPFSIMQCLYTGEIGPHWIDRQNFNEEIFTDQITGNLIPLMYSNVNVTASIPHQLAHFSLGKGRLEEFYIHSLIHGYFTVAGRSDDDYNFTIPNHEIRDYIFHSIIEYWLIDEFGVNETLYRSKEYDLSGALTNYKMEDVGKRLNNILSIPDIVYPHGNDEEITKFYDRLITLTIFPVTSHFMVSRYQDENGKAVDIVLIPETADEKKHHGILIRYMVADSVETLSSCSERTLMEIYNSSRRLDVERNSLVMDTYCLGISLHKNKAWVRWKRA